MKTQIFTLTFGIFFAFTLNAQFVGPAPLVVPGNNYAFAYSTDGLPSGLTTFGLYFNETGASQGFEFRGLGAAKLVNVQSIAAGMREPGDITFGTTGSLIVNPNRYAFRFSLTKEYGLFFNATDIKYEFRTADASSVMSIQANTGEVSAKGPIIGNSSSLFYSYAVKGDGFSSAEGYLGVQGSDDFDGELLFDIPGFEIGVAGFSSDGIPADNFGIYGLSNGTAIRAANELNTNQVDLATPTNAINASGKVDIFGDIDLVGKIEIEESAGNGMTILNRRDYIHGSGSQNFGSLGDPFFIASQEGTNECSGIFGNDDHLTFWSPGDGVAGQPQAVAYFLDEDRWDGNQNPYDLTVSSMNPLVAYLNNAGIWIASDQNVKQNIQPISGALDKIDKLTGYTYEYRLSDEEIAKGQRPQKVAGVIAQELIKVLPEAVDRSASGQHYVNYNGLIPLLIEAVNELDQKTEEIESLKNKLDQFEQSLTQCCLQHGEKSIDHKTGDEKADIINSQDQSWLGQNIPNPFDNSTIIQFYIPSNVSDAKLKIFDMEGREVKSYQLMTGFGDVTFNDHFSSGTYVYSLINDGKVVSTKKMVKN